MSIAALCSLILVITGVILILVGTYLCVADWHRKQIMMGAAKDSVKLGDAFRSLATLLNALKHYPPGQQLIVFGIVITIVGLGWGALAAR